MTEESDSGLNARETFDTIMRIVKSYRPDLTLRTFKDHPCEFVMEFHSQ